MREQYRRRSIAVLTAVLTAVESLPFCTVSATDYNTWTGYVLCNSSTNIGQYLTVAGGVEYEGASVKDYDADGAAPYNTWYFTETEGGFTVKSALDGGQYYLAEEETLGLVLSKTAGVFYFDASDGALVSASSGSRYACYAPQAVTNTIAGDVSGDGVLNGMDLAMLRQIALHQGVDFVSHALADVNSDGAVDSRDVKLMQDFLLGNASDFAAVKIPECTMYPEAQFPTTTESSTTTTTEQGTTTSTEETTVTTMETVPVVQDPLTFDDFPSEYRYAADWIWDNRIAVEKSTERRNTIFDQIVAGKGTINYVVRWQSYKTVTLEQRQQFEKLVSDSINDWAKWLVGYENWPYDHIDVNIVGWAVLDKSVLLDLQPDEIVYDNLLEPYDSRNDTSNGYETIPDVLPSAPSELSRMDHFTDTGYAYPGGLDKRFDMYLWATQGFPSIGGCGGDWGQRLSDDAYLNMLDGTGLHVLEHELGHGFGMTDFYGGEGEANGFPPGGFPGGENSLMMAGSAMKITDFDGWMLRYMWSKIKDEDGRFLF